jgi:TPR repeat protein
MLARTLKPDAEVVYGQTRIPVYSRVIRFFTNPPKDPPYVISTEYNPDSVQQFFAPFHNVPANFTVANIVDIIALCQELGLLDDEGSFPDQAKKFMLANKEACLIPLLIQRDRREAPTQDLEDDLTASFAAFLDQQSELFQLPWPILERVINRDPSPLSSVDPDRAFNFRVACYQNYGPIASSVFGQLRIDTLTVAQLNQLRKQDPIVGILLGPSVGETYIEAIAAAVEYRELCKTQTVQLAELIEQCKVLNSQIPPLIEKVHRQDQEIQTLRAICAAQFGYLARRDRLTLIPEDRPADLALYRQWAEQHDPTGMLAYGLALQRCSTGPDDVKVGAEWIKRAAEAPNAAAAAQKFHGMALYRGEGVDRNPAAGAEYVEKAADQGELSAMLYAGKWLRDGSGHPTDLGKAAAYFRRGADLGNRECRWEYGQMLRRGEGIARDVPAGVKYIRMAADDGIRAAQLEAAEILRNGDEGVAADAEAAEAYAALASGKLPGEK